ncbi:MAG TPA: histidine kinase [Candidatus Dormibacteraeota bacterium]
MALGIVAAVAFRHATTGGPEATLALAAPGVLPLVAEAAWPQLAVRPWMTAVVAAGALVSVMALVVRHPADADLVEFLLLVVASRAGFAVPFAVSLPLVLAALAVPALLGIAAGAHTAPALGAGTVCAWLAGVGMRAQDRLVRELRAAQAVVAERAASDERQRIIGEIHDLVAHSLSVTMLHIAGARLSLADGEPAEAMDALGEAERTGRDAMREIRMAVGLVAPRAGPGTSASLPRAADLPDLVAGYGSAGLRTSLEVRGDLDALPQDASLSLYRIAQESLANAARHAPDGAVRVVATNGGGEVRLTVWNEVRGAPTAPRGGLGIAGMARRAALLGGRFAAGPAEDGWRVDVTLPAVPS